jgi:hypothetical protein
MKWTEKNYRQKIRQMKEQISDEEIFLSERYQELLRKMSAQITRDHFRNVHIYRDDEPESAGWCDGNMVGINIDNILTQSFYNKELKNKSLVGILGHECGHKNYSNSYLRGKYLDGILKEHKFYPHSPVPEAEGEKECLEALKECFQNEEYTVIRLVYKTAAYLNNLLEDVYVEEKMCRQYPGSIRQGIQMNRTRHSDLSISLKKQMEMGRARTEIMLNVLTQYTLSGSVNDWEGVGQEYTECLDACIPVIHGAVKAVQESARFEATNQILLKIWKFIKADADDVEKSRQTCQGKEAECDQQEQNPEEEAIAGTSEPNQEAESVSEPSEQNLGERAESSQLDQSQKEETAGESSERDQDEEPEQEQSERPEDELPEHNQGDESECNQREEPKCRNTEQNRDQELECEDSEQNQEEHSECEASKPKKYSDCGEQQSSETPEKSQKEQDSPNSIDSDHQEQSQEEKNSQETSESESGSGDCTAQEPGCESTEQPDRQSENKSEESTVGQPERKSDEPTAGQSKTQPGNSKAQASGQRQGFTEDDPERTELLIDELLSQLSSYSGDYISGQTGGEAQDIPWDGAWNPKKQNEAEEQKSPDCTAVTEPDLEERVQNNQAETENEIGALIYNMAKERVDMQFEEELQNALREQMDQIEFGGEHARVEKCLFRSVEISEEAVRQYKEMEKQMRQVMKRLKTQVLPFLEKRQTRMEKGMPMGRRMDHRTVYRPDRKVFQRRSLPSEEQDTVMAVLIDLSGSMRMDDRINYAIIAALCLYQFGQEAGIPMAVYGHHTDISWDWKKETVCIHSFAEFDSMDGKDKYRIMDARSCGANRDGVAVQYMGEMLLARPEKQKLLILISDGLPNGLDYSGMAAKKDLRKIKANLTRRGVLFLAAAIGDDKAAIQDIYEEAFLDISDLKKLPEKLAKQVLKKIS